MKITKYKHACVMLQQDGQTVIIDPGSFTALPKVSNLVAIIVTHIHGDHLDETHVQSLLAKFPDALVVSNEEVISQLETVECHKKTVYSEEHVTIGNFSFDIYGHDHNIIYKTSPCKNIGVMVNGMFYYPGDSFTVPGVPVKVLAAPASGPWMKASEAMDFIAAVKPTRVFPTHNDLLSKNGEMVQYNWLKQAAEASGSEWFVLEVGESTEL